MTSTSSSRSTNRSAGFDAAADPNRRLHTALREAGREIQDALDRLHMAQTDVEGKNESIDDIESFMDDTRAHREGLQASRARRIAASVADDLETVVTRLRRAADRCDSDRAQDPDRETAGAEA